MADSNPSPSFQSKKFPQNTSTNRPVLNQEIVKQQQQQQSISPVISSQLPYNNQYQHQQNHRSSNKDSFKFRNQQQHSNQPQHHEHRPAEQLSLEGQKQDNFFSQQNELPTENRRSQQFVDNSNDKRRISQSKANTKQNPYQPAFQQFNETPQFQFSSPKKPQGALKPFKQDWGASYVDLTLPFSPLNQHFSQSQQQINEQITSRQNQQYSNRQVPSHGRMNIFEVDQSKTTNKHEDDTQKGQIQIDNQQQWQRNNIVGVRKQKKGIQKYDSQQTNNNYRHFHQQMQQQQNQNRSNQQQNSRDHQQKQQQQLVKSEQDSSQMNTTSGQFFQSQQPQEDQELPSFFVLQQYKKFKKLKQKIKRNHANKKQLAAEARQKAKENEELGKQLPAGSESLALQRSNSNISMLDSIIERDDKKERQIRRVSVFLQEKSNADPASLKKLVVRLYQELGRKVETNKSLKESIRQKNERISELRKEKGIEEVLNEQIDIKDDEQSEVYFSQEGDDDSSESAGADKEIVKEQENQQKIQLKIENQINKVEETQQIQQHQSLKGNQINKKNELSPLARLIRRCSIPFKPEPLCKSATEPTMFNLVSEPIIEENENAMQVENEQRNPMKGKYLFEGDIDNKNKGGEIIKDIKNLIDKKEIEQPSTDEKHLGFSLQKSHSF